MTQAMTPSAGAPSAIDRRDRLASAALATVLCLAAACSSTPSGGPDARVDRVASGTTASPAASGMPVSGTSAVLSPAAIAAIVDNPDRTDADRQNDVRRKPAPMLAFMDVRPGMTALDLVSGGGYTAELLARAIGPTGRVIAVAPPSGASPALERRVAALKATPASGRTVAPVDIAIQPLESPVPSTIAAGSLDLVTFMYNYHDLGSRGVDRARMNRAIHDALRPGGHYIVADHSGRTGTGISESGTLHRIEEALVRQEVEAAGFELEAEGQFLRNPADPRDRKDPDGGQPKDEFMLKFVRR